MQKSFGIASLVIAIVSIFIPLIGPWLTIIAGALAAFAYGEGFVLGLSSIIINLINILFMSPSVWIVGGLASFGAALEGKSLMSLGTILLAVQIIALAALIVFNKTQKAQSLAKEEYRKKTNPVNNPTESDESQEHKNNFSATSVFTSSTKNTSEQPTSEVIGTAPYLIAERAQTRLGTLSEISNSKAYVSRSPKWRFIVIGLAMTTFIAFFGYLFYGKNQEANQLRLELEQNAMAHKSELERLNEEKIAEEEQAAPSSAKTKATQIPPINPAIETATVPIHSQGDTYLTQSVNLDGSVTNTTERKIILTNPEKIVVESKNIKSNVGYVRKLEFTPEWNLVSVQSSDGSGLYYSPPLKYFEFPLTSGKTWRQTSIETNIKTGNLKEHTLSALVGDWENITVPAGNFRGVKVTIQTELVDRSTGLKTTGTDTSWYVPEVRKSVRSLTSSRSPDGVETKQELQLIKYDVVK
jgi:hypothetical protein